MNIGLTNEYFLPFTPGGAEWSLFYLARALVSRGHKVVIITPNYGVSLAEEFEDMEGVRVYRFPFPGQMDVNQRVMRYRWLANPIFYLWSALHIRRIAAREKVEVLHAQNKYSLPGSWLAARLLKIPLLLTIRDTSLLCATRMCLHRYDSQPEGCTATRFYGECMPDYVADYISPRTTLGRAKAYLIMSLLRADTKLRQFFTHRADGIVGVSQGILDIYALWGLDIRDKARVVYNIPPSSVKPKAKELARFKAELSIENKRIILFVGQGSTGKGMPDLLIAADRVAEVVANALFLFVGKNSLDRQEQHIRSLGVLPNKQVLQLYHMADVVVVPSICQDALSRVILEAMSAGKPVVGTDVGGTAEMVINNLTGRLVPRHSPDKLAEAIIEIITQPALRDKWGRAAKEHIHQRFNVDKSIDTLVSFYKATIKVKK